MLPGDFVTAEDGTGHRAHRDRVRRGRLPARRRAGPRRSSTRCGSTAPTTSASARTRGAGSRTPTPTSSRTCARRGRLLRAETLLHAYPHCWRCGTPLLYYAKPSWYIRTTALRDRLLAANETVNWYPPHIKHGRFGKWLENNVDWAISRERYWGTPLPVWRCEAGHADCLGSLAELERALRRASCDDLHRPVRRRASHGPCAECGGEMRRVPEVIDVWFDSGSMPFAQCHAPFENQERFERDVPGGLHLRGDRPDARLVLLAARDLDAAVRPRAVPQRDLPRATSSTPRARRCRSRKGNIVEPWDVLDAHGADAFRWYFFTSKQPWDGYLFSAETVGEAVRQFLLQLWNTYGFYVLYANAQRRLRAPASPRPSSTAGRSRGLPRRSPRSRERDGGLRRDARRPGDRGVRRRALQLVRAALAPALLGRRPGGVRDAARVPGEVAKLLAPFCPFVADAIYENLDGSRASVHLATSRRRASATLELEAAMAVARETVRLGLAARGAGKLKVRQPLRAAVVVAAGAERAAIERLADDRARGAQRQGAALRRRGRRARLVRGEAQLPLARAALRQADAPGRSGGRSARPRPRRGGAARRASVAINIDGHEHELGRRRPDARDAAAGGLPARARGLTRGRAGPAARRGAAARGPGPRDRPRGPERAHGAPACRSRTGSSSRSAATPSCSPPRASTRRYIAQRDAGDHRRLRRRLRRWRRRSTAARSWSTSRAARATPG